MTDDADPGEEHARIPEDEYREGLSDILLRVGGAASTVCLDTPVSNPSAESPAAVLLARENEWAVSGVTSKPLLDAMQNLDMALMSGHDHMETLGLSLAVRRVLGSSFATVLRGALEAYARAWFLIGDQSAKSVLTQFLASRHYVLDRDAKEYPDSRGTPQVTELSREASKMLADLTVLEEAWGIPFRPVKGDGYKKRVDTLLSAYAKESGHDLPPDIYRRLSLTAHAETIGYNYFTKLVPSTDGEGRETFTMRLDYLVLNMLTETVVGVHYHVMLRYLKLSGAPRHELDEWLDALRFSQTMGERIFRANTAANSKAKRDGGAGRP
jgi:hypothetical protein